MKNIIFLLVDCFDYNKIGANEYRKSPTPFLDSLKKRSYWAEKMYSQAPYTEAALIATMCGYDTMSRGGYLKRYKNCPQNLFEMVQAGGYEVYAQMWAHFYPSSALSGIDCLELRPFNFRVLWVYRFAYYAQLLEKKELDHHDILDLADILRDNLLYWKEYYKMVSGQAKETRIIRENMDTGAISGCMEMLKHEIDRFHADPEGYVYELLREKEKHVLFSLFDDECLDQKTSADFREKIAEKYSWLNQKIYRTGNQLNRRNNHLNAAKLLEYFQRSSHPLNLTARTQFSQYLRNFYHVRHNKGLLRCLGEHYDRVKDWLSTRRMMEYFLDWESIERDSGKPYFAYLHTEDIHGQCTVFNICSGDEDEIDSQLAQVDGFLEELPPNYRGNLGYDLGLMNLDHMLEWFCKELEKRDILKDTVLVITSDHGCGTNYCPLRGDIMNFHDECYHVPFILYGAGVQPFVDHDFHITKDIMATVADLVNVTPPKSSTGISIFSSEKRKWINQEYMGPGCPDMYRRPIWMCAFDEQWKIFIKVNLMQDQFNYTLEEIYDLKKDKKELKNLAKSEVAREASAYLLSRLDMRWREIKNEYSRSGNYGE